MHNTQRTEAHPFLSARRIERHYGGIRALDRVDLDVAVGEARVWIGMHP